MVKPKDTARRSVKAAAPASTTVGRDSFRLKGEFVEAQFIRRSSILFVTFDNLATVGVYDPPQPWLHAWMDKAGFSILGLIASRKDWYRNADTPRILAELRDSGFFDGFERVVFTGTSMGGYAALTYSRIVPGSVVLAFSPQSTLNQEITPFEKRFRYALRKWDWQSPEFLDAADAVADAREVWLFYDPFVAEDRAHAARFSGDAVRHVECGHFGHRLMRQLKACDVLDQIFREIGEGRFDTVGFRKALRSRHSVKTWRKELIRNLETRGHLQLVERIAETILKDDPKARYARKAQMRVAERVRVQNLPMVEEILVDEGDPTPPFRGAILKARNAMIVPERDHDAGLASGVLLADRSYCDMSRAWIRAGKSTPPPVLSAEEPIEKLAGRHVFAGHMRGHFGHFLVESTARLWALRELEGKIDSVIYLPYRGAVKQTRRVIAGRQMFFELLGLSLPVQTFGTAVEVEELYVPELGFGWQQRYAGSPAYRSFMREQLGRTIAPEGGENLYISRARLASQRGGVLGETVIEENLAQQGYEIFYPEKHPLDVQIARYKAARRIVALDGSALHLAAFFLKEGSKVAIILRRSKANAADYVLQYQSFCGVTPDVIDVIRKDWISGDARRVDFRSVGELDFATLFDRLETLGYSTAGFSPDLPSKADIHATLKEFSERRSEEFAPIGDDD